MHTWPKLDGVSYGGTGAALHKTKRQPVTCTPQLPLPAFPKIPSTAEMVSFDTLSWPPRERKYPNRSICLLPAKHSCPRTANQNNCSQTVCRFFLLVPLSFLFYKSQFLSLFLDHNLKSVFFTCE